jgi:hypothetical protein
LIAAKERKRLPPRARPAPLEKVPWDLAQDAMGIQPCVIAARLAGLLVRHAQDVMRVHLGVPPRESG